MAKTDTDITAVRGDTIALGVELYDDDGNLITDDLDEAYFSCKQNQTDTNYVFQKTLEDGITKTSAGKYTIRIAPEDTDNLAVGTFFYDLEIHIDDDVYTPLKGKLKLEQDITREG